MFLPFQTSVMMCANPAKKYSVVQEIGLAIIFQLSAANHSCVPNAHKGFLGFSLQIRASKPIAKGETITLSFIKLQANRAQRQAQMMLLQMPLCQCLRCRLHLDKDIDYEEYNSMNRIFNKQLMATNKTRTALKKDFTIDWQLILYMKYIFGEYHPGLAMTLIRSFVYFAENSRYASKSLLRLSYKEIEPIVRITHSSDHPYYKNFQNFAANYINID